MEPSYSFEVFRIRSDSRQSNSNVLTISGKALSLLGRGDFTLFISSDFIFIFDYNSFDCDFGESLLGISFNLFIAAPGISLELLGDLDVLLLVSFLLLHILFFRFPARSEWSD